MSAISVALAPSLLHKYLLSFSVVTPLFIGFIAVIKGLGIEPFDGFLGWSLVILAAGVSGCLHMLAEVVITKQRIRKVVDAS